MKIMFAVSAAFLAATAWGQAQPAPKDNIERPGPNVALGAPYTMEPAPNYAHCTDPDDVKQLTDGVYTEGHFWTQKTTVGWQGAKPVVIVIDLGEVRPICGVSYHTAAGVAGVEWPAAILLFVADADKQFYELGDLVVLSEKHGMPPREGYAMHRFWTDALRTHGRYIGLAVWAQPYTFVDEIEVYGGQPDWFALPREGKPVADVKAFSDSLAIQSAVHRRLQLDIDAIRKQAKDSALPEAVQHELSNELDAVEQASKDLHGSYDKQFRAVLPLKPLHSRVLRVQAKIWQAKGAPPLTVAPAGLWEPLSIIGDPPRGDNEPLQVNMTANEYRAGAFNVWNATQEDQSVEVRITGLPDGTNPGYVTVHEVAWTDTYAGLPVAAALPLAQRKDEAYLIHAPSGLVRQVWLTFHPTDMPSGSYQGQITVQSAGNTIAIPLAFKLYPLRFPDQPRLRFGGWDYTDQEKMYGVTPDNRAALIAHLREHFVNAPWGTAATLPYGECDATGHMTKPPDTAHFDAWLERWPGARQYCVFAAVSDKLNGARIGTPEFETAVKAWATFWAGHARDKGLKPDQQLALLLVDEPNNNEQDAVIAAWAKAVRASDTGLVIWEDPTYNDMSKANPEMVSLCHVLCPNRQIFLSAAPAYREFFADRRKRGTTLEFYSCSGPVRLLDPYSYHRLQAWTAWQCGATGCYFWAFGDTGGASSWNEYVGKGSAYTPLFLDDTSVTPGKHMEACREGIEDYECLAMLYKTIRDAEREGRTGPALDRARSVLDAAPERVLEGGKTATFRWLDPGVNRKLADEARVEILDAIVTLGISKPIDK